MILSILRAVGWNVFLAVIPVVLGYTLAWGLGGRSKKPRLPVWVCIPLALAWLVFLPNTCYLLSEWRHLLIDDRYAPIINAAQERDNRAILSTAKWALAFLAYSGTGVLLFVLAIRPVEQWLNATGRRLFMIAPFLFFLTSLGVYLGLVKRFNSWNLLDTEQLRLIWELSLSALQNPTLLTTILAFAGILWLLYEAVDLWVEAFVERLRKWGSRNSAPAARAA